MAPIKVYKTLDKVFAKIKESCPCLAIFFHVDKAKIPSKHKYYLYFYGENLYGKCTPKSIYPYEEKKYILGKKGNSKTFNKALKEI